MKKLKAGKLGSELPRSLQPFSLEEMSAYIRRFSNNPDMVHLFPDVAQRRAMAEKEFESHWKEALVTVTRLDGVRFFIN